MGKGSNYWSKSRTDMSRQYRLQFPRTIKSASRSI